MQPNPQHLKQQSNRAKLHSWSAYPNCAAKSTAPETAKQQGQVTQLISISKLCSQIHSTWNSKATRPSYTADQHIQTVQPNPQHLKQQSNRAKLHSWSAYPNCAAKSTAPETAKQHSQVTQLISISKLCSQTTAKLLTNLSFIIIMCGGEMMMMSWCLMSSDVIWHIRDKLWPMPKHGSIKATYVRCMRV